MMGLRIKAAQIKGVFIIIFKLIGVCVRNAVNNFTVVRKQMSADRRDEAFKEIDR